MKADRIFHGLDNLILAKPSDPFNPYSIMEKNNVFVLQHHGNPLILPFKVQTVFCQVITFVPHHQENPLILPFKVRAFFAIGIQANYLYYYERNNIGEIGR